MKYKIIKDGQEYKIISTDEDKYGLIDTFEEAEAAIKEIVEAATYIAQGDNRVKAKSSEMMDEMRANYNKKTTISYKLKK